MMYHCLPALKLSLWWQAVFKLAVGAFLLKWIIAKKERKKAQGKDLEAFLMHTTFHFHLVQHGLFIVCNGTGVFECFMTGEVDGFKKKKSLHAQSSCINHSMLTDFKI